MAREAEQVQVVEELEGSVDAMAFPLLAQGHIIPFMCLCELLASKNLNVVFLTTPLNAKRLRAKQNPISSSRVRIMAFLCLPWRLCQQARKTQTNCCTRNFLLCSPQWNKWSPLSQNWSSD
ncbi:hypothetical protein SUGI_0794300 [Cryptomeria japonica]|nr:hypothetical protein SUGI_0794300 [Cryptomeria japonica]